MTFTTMNPPNDSTNAAGNAPAFTPGPWKVVADSQHAGKHPCHDNRWIMTADAEIKFGYDPRSWDIIGGSIICEMRDHISAPDANARLIAAAPLGYDVACGLLDEIDRCGAKVSPELEATARKFVASVEATGRA